VVNVFVYNCLESLVANPKSKNHLVRSLRDLVVPMLMFMDLAIGAAASASTTLADHDLKTAGVNTIHWRRSGVPRSLKQTPRNGTAAKDEDIRKPSLDLFRANASPYLRA
jgi:hypothetical protein